MIKWYGYGIDCKLNTRDLSAEKNGNLIRLFIN